MIPPTTTSLKLNSVNSPTSVRAAGFTLIELLVVISIIAILASLAIPAVSRALDSGKGAACLSNLHQIGVAFISYGSDHQMVLPGSTSDSKTDPVWARALASYIKADPSKLKTIFVCPGCKIPVQLGSATDVAITYGMHIGLRGADLASDVARLSDTILCADMCQNPGNKGWSPNLIEQPSTFSSGSGGRGGGGNLDAYISTSTDDDKGNNAWMRYRHNGSVNVVMCDGRATSFKKGKVQNLNVLLQ
jgi:prepilin-type N-terminal cleavage/methylation domain-containing protein/prepilin-type processing-associated H-X9-DG protein